MATTIDVGSKIQWDDVGSILDGIYKYRIANKRLEADITMMSSRFLQSGGNTEHWVGVQILNAKPDSGADLSTFGHSHDAHRSPVTDKIVVARPAFSGATPAENFPCPRRSVSSTSVFFGIESIRNLGTGGISSATPAQMLVLWKLPANSAETAAS